MRDGLLWKEDVRNAFGQLTLDTPSVLRNCFQVHVSAAARLRARAAEMDLPPILLAMHLRCYFGWGGASPAYNLLSALVDSVLAPAIEGVHVTYVDDLNGFGHPHTAPADQAIAVGTIKAVLGPDAHAAEKAQPTASHGEVIGWSVDLPAQMLLPSAKGRRKLLWAFFTVDHRARTWPLLQCQLLSSLAHRYHVALRGMAPTFAPLTSFSRPRPKGHARSPRQLARVSSCGKQRVSSCKCNPPRCACPSTAFSASRAALLSRPLKPSAMRDHRC